MMTSSQPTSTTLFADRSGIIINPALSHRSSVSNVYHRRGLTLFLAVYLLFGCLLSSATGFTGLRIFASRQGVMTNKWDCRTVRDLVQRRPNNSLSILQIPPSSSSSLSSSSSSAVANASTRKSLHPKIGDVVRYYDLDGGRADGQVLLGRITYIFGSTGRYIVEVTELEDVKDGYYAEYSSSRRMTKKKERLLQDVSPVLASYVQTEQAYKVPMEQDPSSSRLVPKVRQATYDLDDYEGPVATVADPNVLLQDELKYQQLKFKLLKNSALVGLVGTVIANVMKGFEDAAIYFAGVVGSLLYLLFLSLKTDTMATQSSSGENSQRQQLGNPLSNLRFFMPVLVLAGVSLYNQSRGDLNPTAGSDSIFDTVTQEQFAAAILGFLTYRLPLFVGQIQDAFAESKEGGGIALPGSAGVALKVLQSSGTKGEANSPMSDLNELVTILLVSGPQFTGRSELVEALLSQDERLVAPKWLLRREDGAAFERLQQRGEFLVMDGAESAGLTRDSIFSAACASAVGSEVDKTDNKKVVVVDANVDLVKKLQNLSGARLIGVWVGLPTVAAFEERIENDIVNGKIAVPEEETKESVIRAKIREIINEIEFGLGSGIFEFTILNENPELSLKELKQAAAYAFK